MTDDWAHRAEIQRRLIEMSHQPGSGFVGVWCDNYILRLKLEPWHDPDKFQHISWEDAEVLVGLAKKPVQSVIITVERKQA